MAYVPEMYFSQSWDEDWGWEPAPLGSGGNRPTGYRRPTSHCILYGRQRETEHSGAPFIRALVPFMRILSSWPNYLPKVLSPNTITLGVRMLTYGFGRYTNIQAIFIFIMDLNPTNTFKPTNIIAIVLCSQYSVLFIHVFALWATLYFFLHFPLKTENCRWWPIHRDVNKDSKQPLGTKLGCSRRNSGTEP